VLLTACSATVTAPPTVNADVYFPQHELTEQTGVPSGDLVARLRLIDECLVLESDGAAYLALWPAGYHLEEVEPVAVSDEGRVIVARVGQQVHVGGGVYPDDQRAFVEELLGAPIEERCVAQRYWLVSEVLE
jgi:hypothetical protein